jgi:hypothetical protein
LAIVGVTYSATNEDSLQEAVLINNPGRICSPN